MNESTARRTITIHLMAALLGLQAAYGLLGVLITVIAALPRVRRHVASRR